MHQFTIIYINTFLTYSKKSIIVKHIYREPSYNQQKTLNTSGQQTFYFKREGGGIKQSNSFLNTISFSRQNI